MAPYIKRMPGIKSSQSERRIYNGRRRKRNRMDAEVVQKGKIKKKLKSQEISV